MSETAYQAGLDYALAQDATDPLARYRALFAHPRGADGAPLRYFCGNSLGLMPLEARTLVASELDDWAALAVEAHFDGRRPWYAYHEQFRERGARLVGAVPGEVVMMNSLTVNLHLMLVSFYRPEGRRRKILIEGNPFPSDRYAVTSHLSARGEDPAVTLLEVHPREGEDLIRPEDISAVLERDGGEIALVLLGGVNYYTGQLFDLAGIAAQARRQGCMVGYDLAHAAGNVELALHDWNVDFAVWCSYKYLNAGPGAIAGCFVHERHGRDAGLERLAGWWGNDPATRFRMDQERAFVPREGADGWQLSNPPILAMAPLLASLELFDEAGMAALRKKSLRLTGYLEFLLREQDTSGVALITPTDPTARGCQLSIRIRGDAAAAAAHLRAQGIVCDHRPPDVIRAAPVPLYNSYADAWHLARALSALPS